MGGWLLFRFVKTVGVALFAAGVAGAFLPADAVDRQRAVYALATPGLVLSWTAGFGLARWTDTPLGAPWISASLLLSLVVLAVLARSVEQARETSMPWALAAGLGFVGTLALMVWRPGA
ncbi:MAG: hypothetical protein ACI8PZ_004647 [Myxococcota bacterium]|jgi:hypothetical protein